MKRIISLEGEITPEDLIQLIAETAESESPNAHSPELNALFSKRHRLCVLLNNLEFTIESYGIINFFRDYEDEIDDLKELGGLLKEIGDTLTPPAIKKTMEFYYLNKLRFETLRKDLDNYEVNHDKLEMEYKSQLANKNFFIPLNNSMNLLAEYIRTNHAEFFELTR